MAIPVAVLLGLLGACATPAPPARVASPPVILQTADRDLEQFALLDIGLTEFAPGVPEDRLEQQQKQVYPEVREAESRYFPYLLRNVLETSGQWGAVRVLPQSDPSAELLVTGTILNSDGVSLRLHIDAKDASGRQWLNKIYAASAGWTYYGDHPDYQDDPFESLYNRIANDLNRVRASLTATELRRVVEISQLRYATALSPAAFSDFLSELPSGRVEIKRLPARNDPMVARIERLRDSEYLFIDTVDAQYGAFYHELGPTYSLWRRYSFGQTLELEELKQSQRSGRRGFESMKESYDNYKEGKIQQLALKELSESFNTEVVPTEIELLGQMVHLNGSLQAQYSEWRRLLRAIYAEETAMPEKSAVTQPGQ